MTLYHNAAPCPSPPPNQRPPNHSHPTPTSTTHHPTNPPPPPPLLFTPTTLPSSPSHATSPEAPPPPTKSVLTSVPSYTTTPPSTASNTLIYRVLPPLGAMVLGGKRGRMITLRGKLSLGWELGKVLSRHVEECIFKEWRDNANSDYCKLQLI